MRKFIFIAVFVFLFLVSCDDENKKVILSNDSDSASSDADNDVSEDSDFIDDDFAAEDSDMTEDSDATEDSDMTDDDSIPADEDVDLCLQCDYDNRECTITGDIGVCGDCKSGYFALIEDGKCELKGGNGSDCDQTLNGGDCSSGNCVDGVCCDSLCDGLCEGCNVDDAFRGVCTPVAVGSDPDDECSEETASTCGNTGFCDGLGGCQLYDASTVCKEPTCISSNTQSMGAAYCDGTGVCNTSAVATTSCTPYECIVSTGTCGGGVCNLDNPCSSSYFCNNGTCELKRAVGQECTALGNDACATGDCTLDDFNSEGRSYCVPSAPANCSKEGWYYSQNYSFCYSSNSYKTCGSNSSWGNVSMCPNITKRGCTPSGYLNECGYFSADTCSDGSTGAVCNEDTSCQLCSYRYMLSGSTSFISSKYIFDSVGCKTTCLDKTGTLHHDWCASTTALGSHFCQSSKLTDGSTVGICKSKYTTGVSCSNGYECVSGKCLLGKCVSPI